MKRFNTSDIAFVKQCQEQFNLTLPSVALERRRTKFMHTLCCVDRFTWSGRSIHVQCMFVTISVDIALPMYFSFFCFLFHYYLCCIVLPYVVNKEFRNAHVLSWSMLMRMCVCCSVWLALRLVHGCWRWQVRRQQMSHSLRTQRSKDVRMYASSMLYSIFGGCGISNIVS